jgi:hypothetical protein
VRQHRKGDSLFQLINRKQFDALVDKWGVDSRVRGLTTWELTQALLSCFILRLETYRQIGVPFYNLGSESISKDSCPNIQPTMGRGAVVPVVKGSSGHMPTVGEDKKCC